MSELFDKLDTDGDGKLTRAEVVSGRDKLGMTAAEAEALFDELDKVLARAWWLAPLEPCPIRSTPSPKLFLERNICCCFKHGMFIRLMRRNCLPCRTSRASSHEENWLFLGDC